MEPFLNRLQPILKPYTELILMAKESKTINQNQRTSMLRSTIKQSNFLVF